MGTQTTITWRINENTAAQNGAEPLKGAIWPQKLAKLVLPQEIQQNPCEPYCSGEQFVLARIPYRTLVKLCI
jgi:hypothetical protein